jgi:hypothetical protein
MPRSSSLKAAAASSFHRLFMIDTPSKKSNYWWLSKRSYSSQRGGNVKKYLRFIAKNNAALFDHF